MRIAALIVAAGKGTRAGGAQPKQYQMLGETSLLAHTLQQFAGHPAVCCVQTVIADGDQDLFNTSAGGLDVLAPVTGGPTRQDSVRLGLESLSTQNPDAVLVHDGARPFVSSDLIDRVCQALVEGQTAVLPVLPVADTLKQVSEGHVTGTISRDHLAAAQTPQGFAFAGILAAHKKLAGKALTDDAAVAEAAGINVVTVPGEAANFKVTTAGDLERARLLMAARKVFITGQGFDVHAFGTGGHVMLCGLAVPHSRSLAGHSDADVALHAATDAILGALGAGDIGEHFPPGDDKWHGAASEMFLKHAMALATERNAELQHLDITVICEAPKIGPHRNAMRQRLADICALPVERFSVKATTTEGLGFTGRGEGIACMALATLAVTED